MRSVNVKSCFFGFIIFIICAFLCIPIIITIVISFNAAGYLLPPSGFTFRWFVEALGYRGFVMGLRTSFLLALSSSGVAVILGTSCAFILARYKFKGRDSIDVFIMSPRMIPSVIIGLALYNYFVNLGISGSLLSLIIGHTILITPFSIRSSLASFQKFDTSLEEAALNVGASPTRAFFSITLPINKIGIISGAMLCFALSWNEFTLTLFLAGSKWVSLPIELYFFSKYEYSPAVMALSTFIIFFSGLIIILIYRSIGLGAIVGVQDKK